MNRKFAAVLLVASSWAAGSCAGVASAQEAPAEPGSPIQQIQTLDVSEDTLKVARELVRLSGTGRTFDVILPNVADQTKNAFVKANPQMQLGVIEVVDRIALTLVNRRKELDENLARVWASGFSQEEMQELVDFYSTDIGKKFAELSPKVLTVQMAAAQDWSRAVAGELTSKVSAELRTVISAEESALQRDIAGPALELPQPAQ